jgi:hypothetical protein
MEISTSWIMMISKEYSRTTKGPQERKVEAIEASQPSNPTTPIKNELRWLIEDTKTDIFHSLAMQMDSF